MDHKTDKPKGQIHCPLSIVDKEIMSSLRYFTEEMKIDIGQNDLRLFLSRDKQRRSLNKLGRDITLHICSFMHLEDTIVLLNLCKVFVSWIPRIWRIYENMYFKGSTMSTSKATVSSVRQSIAIDWFEYNVHKYSGLRLLLEDLHVPEERIVKLKERNLEIYNPDIQLFNTSNPLAQTVLEFKTNNAEIESCKKEISEMYSEASDEELEFLKRFRWLCPNGYFCSMPVVDDRLYTNVCSERKQNKRK